LAFHVVGAVSTFHKPYLRHNRLIFDLLAAGQVEDAVQELESYLRDAERQVTAAMATNPPIGRLREGLASVGGAEGKNEPPPLSGVEAVGAMWCHAGGRLGTRPPAR
jgi:hypothetical protein